MPSSARWQNWAGDQVCRPHALLAPGSRSDVARVLENAVGPVRVAGAGHSFSDGVLTGGTLLTLERLSRVLDLDRSSGLVRVEAGMTINALSVELARHGRALENLGDIDAQTIAGAVATATHGTGARHPNVSAQVEALELVLADGTERTLEAADGDAFLAARVGLGALGVVVALTLRTVPAFTLRRVDDKEPLGDVLDRMDELPGRHDHWEFWVFPHADEALTRTSERTDGPPAPPSALRRRVSDVWLTNRGLEALSALGKRRPRAIPRLNRAATRAAGREERIDESHRVFASPRLVRFTEMETAVPREHARAAVEVAKAAAERHPVNFPIEVRFVAADDALLSPAHGRETCYVAVHAYRGMPWQAYFREVEDGLRALGGRPHWGKRFRATHVDLRERYPRWDDFQAVRARLDPGGRFANAYVRRVLGPVAEASSAARASASSRVESAPA